MSGGWLASYVVLWLTVVVLCIAVVALLRQIGVLHARLAPLGTHPAGEGPAVGEPAPLAGPFPYEAPATLVAFTSPTCEVCAALRPSITALRRQYHDLAVLEVEHAAETAATFQSFNVHSTPYFVVVDGEGIVRGGGVANSLEQLEELLAT